MRICILILSALAAMMSILGGPQIDYGNALDVLNITNTTDVNGAGGNTTVPEDDETGNIVGLPGKCLGSALCPD